MVTIDHHHIGEHDYTEEHPHPTPREYAIIAVILTVLTAIEVALFFVEFLPHTWLAWVLIILMAIKFIMVVGWYMHLKFDHIYFTLIFTGGLFIATSILIALAALFSVFTGGEPLPVEPVHHH